MNAEKLGAFVARCRKVKGITQQQLADELGITNKAVSKWETGLGMPDISILPDLAKILEVTVDELLNGEKKDKNKDDSEQNVNTQYCDINSNSSPKKIIEYHENNKSSNEVTEYLINKSITRFKLVSIFSTAFAIMGLIIPYFIWLETKDYSGVLFGIWFEICSAGIFYAYYITTKNEAKSYNQTAIKKVNITELRNNNMKILIWLWPLLPLILVTSVICDIFALNLLIKIIATSILYILTLALIQSK